MNKKINMYSIFYLALFLWSVVNLLTSYTFLTDSFSLLLYLRYFVFLAVRVFCITKMFYDARKVGLAKTFLLVLLLAFFEWNSITTGINIFVYMAYFVFSSYGISIQKSFKCLFYSVIVVLIITLIAYFSGAIKTNNITTLSGITKMSLGFTNPNTFGLLLAYIVVTAYICYRHKPIICFLCIVCFLGCYLISYSRTSLFIIGLVFVLQLFDGVFNKQTINKTRFFFLLSTCAFLLSLVVSFGMASNLLDFSKYNELLSGRVRLYQGFMSHFGINLFGHALFRGDISLSTYGLSTLDNSYLLTLLGTGLVSLILFILGSLFTLSYLAKKQDYRKMVLFSCLALIGVFETFFVRLEFNPMLLLFGGALFGSKRHKLVSFHKRALLTRIVRINQANQNNQ